MKAMNEREIAVIVEELKQLEGTLFTKAHQPGPHDFLLELFDGRRARLLFFSIDDDLSRLHLVDKKPKNPPSPYGFGMLLRAKLAGLRLAKIEATKGDRLVRLDFSSSKENAVPFQLIVELTGRHANALLLTEEKTILAACRKNRSKRRKLVQGAGYEPPTLPKASEGRFPLRFETSEQAPFAANENAAGFFMRQARAHALGLRTSALNREIKRRLKRLTRAKRAIEAQLAEAERAEEYRKAADLLQIHFHALDKMAKSVTLEDVIEPEKGAMTISLDPAMKLRENIAAYYKKAKRALRAKPKDEARMEEIEEEMDLLLRQRELLASLQEAFASNQGDRHQDEQALVRLERKFGLGQKAKSSQKTPEQERALPYRRFTSADGFEIRVGRSAKDNMKLTFGQSKGEHVWFHAAGYAGSHVTVVLGKSDTLQKETMLDAATLAAHYSKAKGYAIEVQYTKVKQLRKMKGGEAGQVVFHSHKSIFIDPDEARIRRLFSKENKT